MTVKVLVLRNNYMEISRKVDKINKDVRYRRTCQIKYKAKNNLRLIIVWLHQRRMMNIKLI